MIAYGNDKFCQNLIQNKKETILFEFVHCAGFDYSDH